MLIQLQSGRDKILSNDGDRLFGLVVEAQMDIFRLAKRDHGLSLTDISGKSNIPYQNIKYYAGGHGAMPIVAVLKLVGVIPDDLLSRLFLPVEKQITSSQCEMSDHDTLASNCIGFAAKLQGARHPASPEGVDIAPCEDADLRAHAARLRVA
jgi:hypothetical protein